MGGRAGGVASQDEEERNDDADKRVVSPAEQSRGWSQAGGFGRASRKQCWQGPPPNIERWHWAWWTSR